MENIEQLIIYIVLGIIYSVFRAKRKQKNTPRPQQPSRPQSPVQQEQSKRKASSFEELLREFQLESEEEQEPKTETYVDINDEDEFDDEPSPYASKQITKNAPEYEQEGSYRSFSDEESKSIYEKSVRQAEKFDAELDESIAKASRFGEFKIKKKSNAKVTKLKKQLKTSEGAKNAFVMSQIFERRFD